MKQVKIALVGMGRIGKIHFKNIQHQLAGAEIVAVADLRYDTALKEIYNGILFSENPDEVITLPEVDAILICTPTSSHAALIEKGIQSGKHIFCEKPMDLSLEKTTTLSEMAKEAGVKLMLGFNRRFDPDFMQANQSVRDGKIGDVQIVKITSRDPGPPPIEYIKHSGGLFMDMAIHDFDMARHIMGKEVAEVYSRGLNIIDHEIRKAGDIDTALTTLVFEDGTYAVIDNSRKAAYGYDQRLEIFGDKGMIKVGNNLHNQNVLFNQDGIHHALPLDFFMDRYAKSYLKEMELFIDALVNDKEMPAGGEDGLKATQIAYAAKMSVETGRPVKLSEVMINSHHAMEKTSD